MKFEKKTYFEEHEDDDVRGFTLLETNEESGRYRIGEKWLRDDKKDLWIDYWIPQEDLESRVDEEKATPKGKLTDEQFSRVCDSIEWYTEESSEEVPA